MISLSESHRIDAFACPCCGQALDAVTGLDTDNKPNPGDVSICIKCGAVAMFADGGGVRQPTAAEWQQLKADPTVQLALMAQAKMGKMQ